MTDKFDVLVIGAGAAGLYTALCLPEHLHVGLINKNTLPVSASDWAGEIAGAIAPEDSAALHVEDTLAAGAGLCDLEAVKFLVEEAGACIDSLVKMGVAFDRTTRFSPHPKSRPLPPPSSPCCRHYGQSRYQYADSKSIEPQKHSTRISCLCFESVARRNRALSGD